ncbi:MAG: hypothetical protein GXY44_13430, partial [Phycisphaerales bacterium]|nr:hypothetical protein [Phycisphaerales bacterium]
MINRKNTTGLPESDPRQSRMDGDASGGRKTRPKRRRWLKGLGVVLLLGLILLVTLPWLLSTASGSKMLVATANRWLPGELEVRSISLSWRGPCTIQGVSLKDTQDREVARIEDLTWTSGLVRAAASLYRFAEVRIDQPEISLIVDHDGRISLIDALVTPTTPPSQQEPVTLPPVIGRVVIENGTLRIVRPDERTLEITRINTTVTLDTLNHLEGQIDFVTPQEGRLAAEITIDNLAPDGQPRPFETTMTVRLTTPQDIPIAELAAFVLDRDDLKGKINLNLQADIEKGAARLKLITKAADLQIRPTDGQIAEPLDVQLTADVQVDRENLAAQTTIEGTVGNGGIDLTLPLTETAGHFSFDTLLAALLEGQTDSFPQFTMEGRGKLDLARLARTFPDLMAVRSDVDVTSGTFDLDHLRIRGGREPSLAGALALSNLVTRTGDEEIQWTPVAFKTDLLLEPSHGLKIEQAEFSSGFGRLTAAGGAEELSTTFQFDLTELNRQLGQIMDTGEMVLAGQVAGNLDLKRPDPEQVELSTTFKAENLNYQAADRQWQSDTLTFDAAGRLKLTDSQPDEVLISNLKINADDKIMAAANGRSRLSADAFEGQLDLEQADLAYLNRQLKNLGLIADEQYTGTARLRIKVHKNDAQAPLVSEGDMVLRDAHVGPTLVSAEDMTLQWSDLSYAFDTGQLQIKTAKLAGSMANLVIDALDCRLAEPLQL